MVGCVRNTAYNGIYKENPFNFEHFNLSNIAVHIDSQSDTVPSQDPDFTNSLYLRCFHSIFGGAGKVNTDEDLDVSRTEYDKGYTLYGFNLATDHDQVFEVSKRGSVRIYLKPPTNSLRGGLRVSTCPYMIKSVSQYRARSSNRSNNLYNSILA